MFWIGMIVGIIFTIAALAGVYHLAVMQTYGSHEEFDRAYQVLITANENRESRIVAYTDYGATLDSYVLKKRK